MKNTLELVENGKLQLIETIKLLLYKIDYSIFDRLDFDNDEIYTTPLLFAFFNSDRNDEKNLLPIILSYLKGHENDIIVYSDHFGRIYLPNIGWLLTDIKGSKFLLNRKDNAITLSKDGAIYPYIFEPTEYVPNTKIELLKYPIPLLDQCYYDVDGNIIEIEIEAITNKHRNDLQKAFNLIQEYLPEHFDLIKSVTQQIVIFNVDTFLRNSFATPIAHGVGFFNACQESYNEVFFVDDIAHQTGHIIFSAMINDFDEYVKVEKGLVLEVIPLPDSPTETRNIHVIFHALYTYYTTFICLDACLDADVFAEHKKQESLARIGFYLRKCYHDLNLIEKSNNDLHTEDYLFTEKGRVIYNLIKDKYLNTLKKYGSIIRTFDLDNQPYNFNYAIFLESNPVNETN